MGFRSDVREFFGALLGLVRPSGPWCFPVREGGVFVGTAAPLQQQTTKVVLVGFEGNVAFYAPLPSFRAMVFCCFAAAR